LKILKNCFHRKVCLIDVCPTDFPNDPCPGTTKYLTVAYNCVSQTAFLSNWYKKFKKYKP